MSSAVHRDISTAILAAICAYWYAVRAGRSPHGVPSCRTSVFAVSAEAGEPGSQVQVGCAVHRSTRLATSSIKIFSSSLNPVHVFLPRPERPRRSPGRRV